LQTVETRASSWSATSGLQEYARAEARVPGFADALARNSASTTGVLPKTPMVVERGRLLLRFDNGFKALAGKRVFVRLRQLARLIGREPVMETGVMRSSAGNIPSR
jgi:hypothetical protein